MCDPISAALLIGGAGASFVGSQYSMAEDARNAQRIAEARNKALRETQAMNQLLSDEARAAFERRLSDVAPETSQPAMAEKQAARTEAIQQNVDAAPAVDTSSMAGAPKVVQSAMAQRLAEAADKVRTGAEAKGRLGGYGDHFFDQSLQDMAAGRDVDTSSNFVRGNMALLPALQDYAEIRATRPSSGLGQILQAIGGVASTAAGARGLSAKPAGTGFFQMPNIGLKGPGGTLGGGV